MTGNLTAKGDINILHFNLVRGARVYRTEINGTMMNVEGPFVILEQVRRGPKLLGYVLVSADTRRVLVDRCASKTALIPEEWILPWLTGQKSVVAPVAKERSSNG